MQICQTDNGIHLDQSNYTKQILNTYGFANIKSAYTPLDSTEKLVEERNANANSTFVHDYMSKVGSINYNQTKTRPDVSFPVSLVSRYSKNPNQKHLDAVNQILSYLSGTEQFSLYYRKDGNPEIEGWVDSDWGGDTDSGKSTSGWIFKLAGSPISWSSTRQKTVASSSTEAEYVAASDACKEGIWLLGFFNEVNHVFGFKKQKGIKLHIDNVSAIKLTKNPEFHGRTKHINIRHHLIREYVKNGTIIPVWISGQDNIADILTKPLPRPTFTRLRDRLGLVDKTTDSSKGETDATRRVT
jgi:hypothetical protein